MATGDYSHLEIPADDPERAKRFYGEIFGWSFSDMEGFPDYHLFQTPSGGAGGAVGRRNVNTRSQTMQYVEVDSIDAALARVAELGGTVLVPKEEVPGQGFFAVVSDSEGNEIGLWENPPPAG